jgi:hypothetical protein
VTKFPSKEWMEGNYNHFFSYELKLQILGLDLIPIKNIKSLEKFDSSFALNIMHNESVKVILQLINYFLKPLI